MRVLITKRDARINEVFSSGHAWQSFIYAHLFDYFGQKKKTETVSKVVSKGSSKKRASIVYTKSVYCTCVCRCLTSTFVSTN